MTTQTVTLRLVAENGQFVGNVKASKDELGRLGTSGEAAGRRLNTGMTQARRGVESISTQLARARQEVIGFASAFVSVQGVRALTRIVDDYANVTTQIRLATDSQDEFARAEAEVIAISQRTSTTFDATANLYARITRSTREYGVEQARILALTETINQTFAVSGASATSQANAITQLTQAFAGGVLRAEEFNSVIEASPRLAQALADGMGIGVGELRRQVNDGTVDVQRMIAALESQSAAIQAEFDRMPLTIERSFTQLTNAVRVYIGQGDQASGVSRSVAESIALVARNVELLAEGAAALTVVLTARVVTALGAKAGAAIAARVEMFRLAAATDAATVAQIRMTQGEAAAQSALLARSRAARLAAAGTAALRGGLALVGGPAGAAVLAATGIAYLATRESEAEKQTRQLKDQLGGLRTGLVELDETSKRIRLEEVRTQLRELDAQIAAIELRLTEAREAAPALAPASANSDAAVFGAIGRSIALANQLEDDTNSLIDRRRTLHQTEQELSGQLNRSAQAAAGAAAAAAKGTVEADKAIARLREQIAMHGLVTHVAKARAEIELGAYGALSDAQHAALLREAAILDAKEQQAEADKQRQAQLQAALELEDRQRASAAANAATIDQTIKNLREENALLAQGLSLDQAREELRLRALGASEAEISYIRELTRWQQLHADAANVAGKRSADAARAAIEPFQDLRDVIVATGNEWAQAAATIVQGLENISDETKSNTRGYAQLAQGASAFFKEGTGGYKALEAAANAFYAFEIAQQIASMVAGVSASQTKAAAKGLEAEAAGAAAVAEQASAGPIIGFALAAAMVAFLASIGINPRGRGGGGSAGALDAPSGGGSGLRTSGTVLGRPDQDSASVANSIELLVGIEQEGLRISREQLDSLRAIERATAGITGEFARFAAARGNQALSFGGTAGNVRFSRANSTGMSLADMFAILNDPGAYIERVNNTAFPIAAGLQSIFDELGNALVASVTAFGGDAERARRVFREIPLGDLVLREGEDIDAAIQALISSVGDSAIAAASELLGIPLARYQQFGEGALETLVRLTAQFGVLTDGAAALGMSINQTIDVFGRTKTFPATTEQLVAIADDLAQRAGGVEQFATNVAAFLDLTLTESERLARQGGLLRDALAGVGIAMPASADGLRGIAQGLNLTTESGRAAFATLTELAPALGDYYDAIKEREAEIADQRLGLQERLAAATGNAALAEEVRIELLAQQRNAIDASNQALFDQVIAAEAAAAETLRLADITRQAYGVQVALGIADGLDPLRVALAAIGVSVDAVFAAANAGTASLANFFRGLSLSEDALASLSGVISSLTSMAQAADRQVSQATTTQRSYTSAVRETATAVRNTAREERERLETELLQLVGATAELRRRERDALHASNRSLFEHVSALENLKAANDDTISGLRSLRQSLGQAANDAVAAPLAQVRASFDGIAERALAGDAEALRGLAAAGESLRAASEAQATTRTEYLRDLARLSSVAGAAETLAERQFSELAQQTLILAGIQTSIDALRGAQSTFNPAFNAPAIASAPAPRVIVPTVLPGLSAPASSVGDTRALETELRSLRSEVAELKKLLRRLDDRGDSWDAEGLPPTRTAA